MSVYAVRKGAVTVSRVKVRRRRVRPVGMDLLDALDSMDFSKAKTMLQVRDEFRKIVENDHFWDTLEELRRADVLRRKLRDKIAKF